MAVLLLDKGGILWTAYHFHAIYIYIYTFYK